MPTRIQWCKNSDGSQGETWNPWQGCTKISEECRYCYMFREKARFAQDPTRVVRSSQKTFDKPRSLPAGTVVFTCSWSDFLHADADAWRGEAWDIIRMSSDKVFIILTKRIERARDHLPKDWDENFQHVWLGITAGDQITFDKRWPYLSQIPASVYVISHEPALGLISYPQDLLSRKDRAWIIAGGESGTKSEPVRPSHQLWIRNDRDQCVVHGVPFFFKSWGEWVHGVRDCAGYQLQNMNYTHGLDNTVKWVVGGISVRVGRALSGRLIDGRTWDQVPQVSIGSNEPSLF